MFSQACVCPCGLGAGVSVLSTKFLLEVGRSGTRSLQGVGMSRRGWLCPRGGYVPGVGIPGVEMFRGRWVCPHPTGMLSCLTMNLFSHSLDRKF